MSGTSAARLEAIWHDVECGAYSADLPAWLDLAGTAAGPLLELGAGTGRVALRLAADGHEVIALDSAPALLDELRDRAADRRLSVETVCGDARDLDPLEQLDRRFAAILAPMQFVHLLGGPAERRRLLGDAARRLAPGGILAAAVLGEDALAVAAEPSAPLLPDVRELEGWIYSSQPLEVAADGDAIEIRRLRQVVSPAGRLTEERDSVRLDPLSASGFEREAAAPGLKPVERIEVAATEDHVGSTICVLEAG